MYILYIGADGPGLFRLPPSKRAYHLHFQASNEMEAYIYVYHIISLLTYLLTVSLTYLPLKIR